ncbi:hypothetical protein [Staphylococcus massiliensis]|uniref:hypothetical protein n=1 Tax=Staphylococcus massiliensis TaxID=555791 RepID=UPI0003002146|nr:hypothetical protein [Staphylococcus massiliensis]MCG3398653.1 hypothetical protein [Staphylococcus massiliensis]MCG3401215.1 hypothetical protein [Staphylococcus massiliensis]MCG3412608.1 hypothetical protein [Staphylococcus massiliensis]
MLKQLKDSFMIYMSVFVVSMGFFFTYFITASEEVNASDSEQVYQMTDHKLPNVDS